MATGRGSTGASLVLEEHDPRVYRRLMRALLDKKQVAEAKAVGEMAVYADVEGLQTHALFAEALVASKMIPRAVYELESAVLCPSRLDKAGAHAQLAETTARAKPSGGAEAGSAREEARSEQRAA
jgi:hypothetical protein